MIACNRPAGSDVHSPRRASRALLQAATTLAAVVSVVVVAPAFGQCSAPVCTMVSTMGGMSCTAAWMNTTTLCMGANPPLYPMCTHATAATARPVFNTALDRWSVMLRHPPGIGSPAMCTVYFLPQVFAGYCSPQVNITCIVDASDGLPVELLDFSVESDS